MKKNEQFLEAPLVQQAEGELKNLNFLDSILEVRPLRLGKSRIRAIVVQPLSEWAHSVAPTV